MQYPKKKLPIKNKKDLIFSERSVIISRSNRYGELSELAEGARLEIV